MVSYFGNVLLWALPASGKSEIMTFLRGLSSQDRAGLHIGDLAEIDDYPRVASLFEIDDERERSGKERIFTLRQTYDDGGFLHADTWDVLDHHLNARYEKMLLKHPDIHDTSTVMIECARGGPQGASFPLPHGYQRTLHNLKPEILRDAVIFYVSVSPEESRRKNDARYNPKDSHSILSHRVPTGVMLRDYGCDDVRWMMEQAGNNGIVISPSGAGIPIGIFENEDDKTSFVREETDAKIRQRKSEELYAALERVFNPLFERYIRME